MRRVLLAFLLAAALVGWPHPASARAADFDRLFEKWGRRFFGLMVDWRWFKAQALAESGLRPQAVSPVGARGLMQIMPATSAEMARRLGVADRPWDPRLNVMLGVAYDRRLWDLWHSPRPSMERLRLVFASYNAGPGNILRAQRLARRRGGCSNLWRCLAPLLPSITGRHAAETRGYVARIERFYWAIRLKLRRVSQRRTRTMGMSRAV